MEVKNFKAVLLKMNACGTVENFLMAGWSKILNLPRESLKKESLKLYQLQYEDIINCN